MGSEGQRREGPRPLRRRPGLLGERTIASGRDFDETTGELRAGKNVLLLDEAASRALATRLAGSELVVDDVDRKESQRSPYPPFTTSTLQQEANRKLDYSASQTMQLAQKLYENGAHHLYAYRLLQPERGGHQGRPRDDRAALWPRSAVAVGAALRHEVEGAQEAHEAIRPAGTTMATASELGLSGREARLSI
ncbi:MAG: DNA topoisomerase [bacterium]